MRKLLLALTAAFSTLVFQMPAAMAAGGGYELFGDASLVSPGDNSQTAAQVESSPTVPPQYGGINFDIPSGMTFSQVSNLATSYKFTNASCGGGAPRFVVSVTNGTHSGEIWFYFASAPGVYTGCPTNVWTDTGNLATPTSFVDSSQLNAEGGHYNQLFSDAQTAFGSYTVTGIQLQVDADWFFSGPQTVLIDNTQVNSNMYTYEPLTKDSCKNGGWQQITSSPGPFKNQGDCVSYFATGGKNQ